MSENRIKGTELSGLSETLAEIVLPQLSSQDLWRLVACRDHAETLLSMQRTLLTGLADLVSQEVDAAAPAGSFQNPASLSELLWLQSSMIEQAGAYLRIATMAEERLEELTEGHAA